MPEVATHCTSSDTAPPESPDVDGQPPPYVTFDPFQTYLGTLVSAPSGTSVSSKKYGTSVLLCPSVSCIEIRRSGMPVAGFGTSHRYANVASRTAYPPVMSPTPPSP